MNLSSNEWVLFEVAARQTAVLDELLKEVKGYAKIELNGIEERACMDITVIVPSKKTDGYHWFEHVFFYQDEKDEYTDNLKFRGSVNKLGDLITEVKAKIPTWKEELGIV